MHNKTYLNFLFWWLTAFIPVAAQPDLSILNVASISPQWTGSDEYLRPFLGVKNVGSMVAPPFQVNLKIDGQFISSEVGRGELPWQQMRYIQLGFENRLRTGTHPLTFQYLDLIDVSLDSIICSNPIIYTDTLKLSVALTNQSAWRVRNNPELNYQVDVGNVPLLAHLDLDLLPQQHQIYALPPISKLPYGTHDLKLMLNFNGTSWDTNLANNAQTLQYIYARPPQLHWTSIVREQRFDGRQPIPLRVETTLDTTIWVKKVEFYDGNVLLGVDSVAPYEYNWQQARLGEHSMIAKGYDQWGRIGLSECWVILVHPPQDASLEHWASLTSRFETTSIAYPVAIVNQGIDTLRHVKIRYQLDNLPIGTHFWHGALGTAKYDTVHLERLHWAAGRHYLKIWLDSIENWADANRNNDTIRWYFEYQGCGERNEPDNTPQTAHELWRYFPEYAQLGHLDVDWYHFRTQDQAPNFKIDFYHPAADARLTLYRVGAAGLEWVKQVNATAEGAEQILLDARRGDMYRLQVESIRTWNESICYSLSLHVSELFLVETDEPLNGAFQLSPNPAQDVVKVAWNEAQNVDNQLIITDLLGRRVYETLIPISTASVQIPTALWQNGLYLVTLRQGDKSLIRKLQIQH